MENSFKGFILLTTLIITGLSAGLWYAWAVSVIPGTKKVTDITYLETMQHINRAILNPWFFIVFFGPLIGMVASGIIQYNVAINSTFWLMVAALATYLIGTFGVTALGNVPLNDSLDVVKLNTLTMKDLESVRVGYEVPWNRLHMVRTAFSVISFVLLLLAVIKSNIL